MKGEIMKPERVSIGGPDCVLELYDEPGERPQNRTHNELDYFFVRLVLPHLEGKTRVWLTPHDQPAWQFFARLAEKWRGWEGREMWDSYEGNFSLTAWHDGLGHVVLEVSLKSEQTTLWELHGRVSVEAGQLDRIAREVEGFWTSG